MWQTSIKGTKCQYPELSELKNTEFLNLQGLCSSAKLIIAKAIYI